MPFNADIVPPPATLYDETSQMAQLQELLAPILYTLTSFIFPMRLRLNSPANFDVASKRRGSKSSFYSLFPKML
ncbi:MAG: hypothetical protein DRJ31_04095 [Candidatus Methanomethylicota archaeon]|uniref:Uncharacterized protein n=1 Tax=Thermoproteota archaeon TaxID=2056631 RepID=A0A497ERF3_9CREN|nr:MAG: hypothetical protein DRJ31_04095 [Candidatus Verstraetearchaeota archaeon]